MNDSEFKQLLELLFSKTENVHNITDAQFQTILHELKCCANHKSHCEPTQHKWDEVKDKLDVVLDAFILF